LKLKKALAALIFVAFLSSSGFASATPDQTGAYRKFVIYYGWYTDGNGRLGNDIDRIIRSQPVYVVSPYHTSSGLVNLTPEVFAKFHYNSINVLVYIATGNAGRDLDSVMTEIKIGLEAGAAGVMLDEVAMLHHSWQVDYYEKIYDYVKSFGADQIVVANPGSILVSESVMSVSDILCFEHQWRLAPAIDWFSKYPPERFMGISSNDIANVMGYSVEGELGLRDTIEAWQAGIGYHFATDSYTRLPSWFEDYQQGLEEFIATGAKLGEVAVKAVDTDGKEISGLWIEVKKNGRTVATGFSPAKFTLPEGSHQVLASNYQNFIFSKWQDGTAPAERGFTATADSPVELVAVYRNEQVEMHIDSLDLGGKVIRGMPVSVYQGEEVVAEGKTPIRLKLPTGTYSILASSSKYHEFDHWSANSRSNMTTITLDKDTKATAIYSNTIESRIDAMSCSPDYREKVVESILRGGTLGGILELRMREALGETRC
jgi:hypothetical protein